MHVLLCALNALQDQNRLLGVPDNFFSNASSIQDFRFLVSCNLLSGLSYNLPDNIYLNTNPLPLKFIFSGSTRKPLITTYLTIPSFLIIKFGESSKSISDLST